MELAVPKVLDVGDPVHMASLRAVFMPLIDADLQAWAKASL